MTLLWVVLVIIGVVLSACAGFMLASHGAKLIIMDAVKIGILEFNGVKYKIEKADVQK